MPFAGSKHHAIGWCLERAALHTAQSCVSREAPVKTWGAMSSGIIKPVKIPVPLPPPPPAPLPLEELLAVDDSGGGRVSFSFGNVTTGRLLTPTDVPIPNLCAYESS